MAIRQMKKDNQHLIEKERKTMRTTHKSFSIDVIDILSERINEQDLLEKFQEQ